jgi:hypothetical protein
MAGRREKNVTRRGLTTNQLQGRETMTAAQTNQISFNPSVDDMQAFLAALQVLLDRLAPLLVDLNAEERHGLSKMGTRTVEFVGKTLQYARESPQFNPAFFDVDEFERDFAAIDKLRTLQRPIRHLADMLDDSMLLSGSEAYGAALSYYQSIKVASKRGLPGAALIAEDLGAQFVNRGPRPAAPPAPVPAPAPAPAAAGPTQPSAAA